MKTSSPMTTAGHSAFYRLILILSLYFGQTKIYHRRPEQKRCRTHPMPTPELTITDEDNNNKININDNPTSIQAYQQNALAHQGGNQRKREKKKQQLRPFFNTYERPGTEDNKRCTPQQDDIIYDKKNEPTTGSVTPIVVTQVETFDGPERASSLKSSHGAAELQYKTVHPRPWDV